MFAPFVTLIAAMWVVFELRRGNELVPLMAAGVAPSRIFAPIFAASLALAGVMYVDQEIVIPRFSMEFLRNTTKLGRDRILVNPIPDRRGGVLSARYYFPQSMSLGEPRYSLLDSKGQEVLCAIASQAIFCPGQGWRFEGGTLVECPRASAPFGDRVSAIPRSGLVIETNVEPLDVECANVELVGLLTSDQLRRQLERIPSLASQLRVQLARRTSYPCASLVLIFLGLPFVLGGDNRTASLGLLACVALCALFFMRSRR
jgi:lipopolysaccharide export LptBFGC system permease protein LptF